MAGSLPVASLSSNPESEPKQPERPRPRVDFVSRTHAPQVALDGGGEVGPEVLRERLGELVEEAETRERCERAIIMACECEWRARVLRNCEAGLLQRRRGSSCEACVVVTASAVLWLTAAEKTKRTHPRPAPG